MVDADQSLGDGRLAGPGRPVEEHGALGPDGRAELVEQGVVDHQVAERLPQAGLVDLGPLGLGHHHVGVVVQAHRRRAHVATQLHALVGLRLAQLRQGEHQVAAVGALHLHQLQVTKVPHQPLGQRHAQRQRLGQTQDRRAPVQQGPPQDQVLDQGGRDVQVGDAVGYLALDRLHRVPSLADGPFSPSDRDDPGGCLTSGTTFGTSVTIVGRTRRRPVRRSRSGPLGQTRGMGDLPALRVRDLHKRFGGLQVLRGVDLDLRAGRDPGAGG